MKIIRVFPRRTRATPIDGLAYVGPPDLFAEADAVNISVAFTWDLPAAERLEREWRPVAPVKIGGPALRSRGGDFEPGMYLRPGYVITSRGCPNRCWFCSVPWREGHEVRELPIRDGWNVLDDNLLACSESHIRAVFAMLSRQPKRAQFTGGLEAARLQDWHVELLVELRPRQVFFAYDSEADWIPLIIAAQKMRGAGFDRHTLRAYVLIGYPRDTIDRAEERLRSVVDLGIYPMAMLWRDEDGETDRDWRRLQRLWARPAMIAACAAGARR